jgi:RimJ/RimL family protein N-acetyltransferase
MSSPPSRAIPVLRTGRLRLRPPVYSDFAAYARMMASPRAVYMTGPIAEGEAWSWFCHDVAQWHLFGHGGLTIDLLSTGAPIGQVGINHGPKFPEKELGWLLYEGCEGHGYATEAAARLRDWAFAEGGLTTLVSYVDPDNIRSQAVAERLGGWRDPDAPRDHPAVIVYRYAPSG